MFKKKKRKLRRQQIRERLMNDYVERRIQERREADQITAAVIERGEYCDRSKMLKNVSR
jgi:hypothetical protein